jgi:hypothetical protein
MNNAAYNQARMLIDAGYDIDVAIEVAAMDHRLDEYQADDLALRVRRAQ